MKIVRISLVLFVSLAVRCVACTSWVVMPEKSASGRMIVHKCRDQRGSKLTAFMRTADDGVRWMCIGSNGFATFEFNEYGVAMTSNYGGKYFGQRRKRPKNAGSIFDATVGAKDAVAGAEIMRDLGRAGWRQSGGLFLVADAKRAFTVEIGPGYGEMMEIPGGIYVISNSLHLGGCESCFGDLSLKLPAHRAREANARAELHKNEVNGKHTVTGLFKASRLTGKNVPFNSFSLSAVCFELDAEFPELLGCAYVALGPQQHTVYLPTPMALEQFPEDMQNGKWGARAFALRAKIGDDHKYLPRIEALEKEFLAEFSAVREQAAVLLRAGKRDEAKKLLNDTFNDHYSRAKELLRQIADEAGVDADAPIIPRKDEGKLHEII